MSGQCCDPTVWGGIYSSCLGSAALAATVASCASNVVELPTSLAVLIIFFSVERVLKHFCVKEEKERRTFLGGVLVPLKQWARDTLAAAGWLGALQRSTCGTCRRLPGSS